MFNEKFKQDTAIDQANVDASSDSTVNFVKVVSHCLVVSMEVATFRSNVSANPVGMDCFALNVSYDQTEFVSNFIIIIDCTAICRTDCHQTRGYCEAPGECRCRLGWAGPTCKECQVLPGCQHGTCSKPLECKCLPGYTGILCQNRKCDG